MEPPFLRDADRDKVPEAPLAARVMDVFRANGSPSSEEEGLMFLAFFLSDFLLLELEREATRDNDGASDFLHPKKNRFLLPLLDFSLLGIGPASEETKAFLPGLNLSMKRISKSRQKSVKVVGGKT